MEKVKQFSPVKETDQMISCWFTVDEETTMELSKLLESSGHAPPPVKVRFVQNPYVSTMLFQSSSAYVTINGNEEMCGSSFSDADSSVMASVDVGDAFKFLSRGAWVLREDEARGGVGVDDVDDFLMSSEGDLDGGDGLDESWKEFLGEEILGLV